MGFPANFDFDIPESQEEVERRRTERSLGYRRGAGLPTSSSSNQHFVQTRVSAEQQQQNHRRNFQPQLSIVSSSDVGEDTTIPGVGRGVPRQDSWDPIAAPRRDPLVRDPLVEISEQRLPSSNYGGGLKASTHSQFQQRHLSVSSQQPAPLQQQQSSNTMLRTGPSTVPRWDSPRKGASRFDSSNNNQQRYSERAQHSSNIPGITAPNRGRPALSEEDDDDTSDSTDTSTQRNEHHFQADTASSTGNHRALRATPLGGSLSSPRKGNARATRRPALRDGDLERLDRLQAHLTRDRIPVWSTTANPTQEQLVHDADSPFAAETNQPHRRIRNQQQTHDPISQRPHPASPSPMRSARGVKNTAAGNTSDSARRRPQRAQATSAHSDFETLAAGIRKEMGIGADPEPDREAGDGSNSGSGFGAGSHHSSASTKVDEQAQKDHQLGGQVLPAHLYLPSGQIMGLGAPAAGVMLPDISGVTSALASPIKARLGVKHVPISVELANVDPELIDRLEALVRHLDGLQGAVQDNQKDLQEHREHIHNVEGSVVTTQYDLDELRGQMNDLVAKVSGRARDTQPSQGSAAQGQAQPRQAPQIRRESAERPHPTSCASAEAGSRVTNSNQQAPSSSATLNDANTSELFKVMQALREEVRQSRAELSSHTGARYTDHMEPTSDGPADMSLQGQIDELRRKLGEVDNALQQHLAGDTPSPRRSGRRSTGSLRGYGSEGDEREENTAEQQPSYRARFPDQPIASSPIKKSRPAHKGRSPFVIRKSQDEQPPHQRTTSHASTHRSVQEELPDTVEIDESTIPAGNRRSNSPRLEEDSRHRPISEDEENYERLQQRADAAFRVVASRSVREESGGSADPHHQAACAACTKETRANRRRAEKREKLKEVERQRAALAQAEVDFLSLVDASTANGASVNAHVLGEGELDILRRVIEELNEEFLHQNYVFRTLAAELAAMKVHEYRKRITQKHVVEAVFNMEAIAARITQLEMLLPKSSEPSRAPAGQNKHAGEPEGSSRQPGAGGFASEKHRRSEPAERAHQCDEHATRATKSSSSSKHSTKGKGKSTQATPMTLREVLANSPPTVDQ